MSEEVIKILDAFADKFGLAIDWTSTNVIPYLEQLGRKYVTYEIATSVVWILISICLLFASKYAIGKAKYFWQKCTKNEYSDYEVGAVFLAIFAGCAIIVGTIIILFQVFDIVTCFTFPEKIIIEELKSIYLSMR